MDAPRSSVDELLDRRVVDASEDRFVDDAFAELNRDFDDVDEGGLLYNDDDEDDDDEDEGVSQNSNYGSKGLFHLVYLMTSVRYTAITRARMIRRFRLTLSIIRVVLDCS